MRTLYIFFFLSMHTIPAQIDIFGAAKMGSAKIMRSLVASDTTHINQKDALGNAPLHYATYVQSLEVTKLLLTHHANPNAKNNNGSTPLHVAVIQGNARIARLLMSYGACPNVSNNDGNTPTHLALLTIKPPYAAEIIQNLCAYGADVTCSNNQKETPYSLAQALTPRPTSVHAHHKHRKNIKHIQCALQQHAPRPYSPLDKQFIKTARAGHDKKMSELLRCTAIDINQQVGACKRTALMYAIKNNRTKIVEQLLEHPHLKLTAQDYRGKTARDYAQTYASEHIQKMLQDYEAELT